MIVSGWDGRSPKNLKVNEAGNLLVKSESEYAFHNLDNSIPMYVGSIKSDGEWMIKRFTESTGEMVYATGAEDYQTNWTNRASLVFGNLY